MTLLKKLSTRLAITLLVITVLHEKLNKAILILA